MLRLDDVIAHPVVGDIQQPADKGLVRGDTGLLVGIAIMGRNALLDHKPALGAHRNDHRILDHLGLHQAQHLGAEVLASI